MRTLWYKEWTDSNCLKFGNSRKSMWTGYHRLLNVPKIHVGSTASGFWEWHCLKLQFTINNLKVWRYLRTVDSVEYISIYAMHSNRYWRILISVYILFALLSHPASSSYQSQTVLTASFIGNLLLMQTVSNFRAKVSFWLRYIIYLSDLTN
jgi:hypothetical protein